MCELYMHSAVAPTRDHPGLNAFLDHAAEPFDNPNGWGVGAYQGPDAQIFCEPLSAEHSQLADWLQTNPPKSHLLLGHIRKATAGGVALANTQPLSRAVGGRRLLYIHNGGAPGFADTDWGRAVSTHAVGTADSELTFLALIDWLDGRKLADAAPEFPKYASRMAEFGPYNVIVADGEDGLAYSDRRHQASDTPSADMRGPGLRLWKPDARSCVISSELLSDGAQEIPRGMAVHVRSGEIVARIPA